MSQRGGVRRWFSRHTFAIPFGRYTGDSELEGDENSTLIGREGQRAFFQDLLENRGQTGAYLVTGNRGAGKTTFVKEALRLAEEDVYGRVLQTNIGRSVFWDKVALLVLVGMLVVCALMCHEILGILVFQEESRILPGEARVRSLIWIAVIPFAALCFAPILYAGTILKDVLASLYSSPAAPLAPWYSGSLGFLERPVQWLVTFSHGLHGAIGWAKSHTSIGAFVLTVAVSAFAYLVTWLGWPLGDPTWMRELPYTPDVALSRMAVFVTASAMMALATSVYPAGIGSPDTSARIRLEPWRSQARPGLAIILVFVGLAVPLLTDVVVGLVMHVWDLEWGSSGPNSNLQAHATLWGNLGGAAICAAGFMQIRQGEVPARHSATPAAPTRANLRPSDRARGLGNTRLTTWYLVARGLTTLAGLIFFLTAYRSLDHWWGPALGHLAMSMATVQATVWLHRRMLRRLDDSRQGTVHRTVPRPRLALALKAFTFAFIGVHLFHPIFAVLLQAVSGLSYEPTGINATLWPIVVVGTLLWLHFLEYEWIIRPYAEFRDDRARDLSRCVVTSLQENQRAHVEDSHVKGKPVDQRAAIWSNPSLGAPQAIQYSGELAFDRYRAEQSLHRQFFRLTFFWYIFSSWMPTSVIRVNLGFEELDHREVVHAMLTGLREDFQDKLVSWRSPTTSTVLVAKFLLVVVVSTMVAEQVFAIRPELPPPVQVESARSLMDDDTSGSTHPALWHHGRLFLDELQMTSTVWHGQLLQWASDGEICEGNLAMSGTLPGQRWIPTWRGPGANEDSILSLLCHRGDDGVGIVRWLYTPIVGGAAANHELREIHDYKRAMSTRRRSPPTEWWRAPQLRGNLALCEFLPCQRDLSGRLLEPELPELTTAVSELHPFTASWTPVQVDGERIATLTGSWESIKAARARVESLRDQGRLHLGLQVRGYHLLTALVVWLLVSVLGRYLPLLPYRLILRQMDRAIDELSGRTQRSQGRARPQLMEYLALVLPQAEEKRVETDRADPRRTEFRLLEILNQIANPRLRLPLGELSLQLPRPQVTFLFDELDKLGTRVETDSRSARDADERERSRRVHKLFADLKNLLSSAEARFIFVGGRNLHDEWLADQTARTPLLTNIFRAAIHLPSLLTNDDADVPRWTSRVQEYLVAQEQKARTAWTVAAENRVLPGFGLRVQQRRAPSFSLPTRGLWEPLADQADAQLAFVDSDGTSLCAGHSSELLRDYTAFLAFRSLGNPKKLKELIESMIRPTGRFAIQPEIRWGELLRYTDHVIQLGDKERFRVQLMADLYRQVADQFEQRYARRDDKLVTALFYFSDFIAKFHRRAFSWTNLERVDELFHIHRAPDHPRLLKELVELNTGRRLHPILHGLYAFRFRSDLAREVDYISRASKEDMAAYNFTLDESQQLKSLFEGNIESMQDRAPFDVFAALGELHDFDGEHEQARYYYAQAIRTLDHSFEEVFGVVDATDLPVVERVTAIRRLLESSPEGLDHARRLMTWGVDRLRLMLQTGLTLESARNYERAELEYRNARTLSRALVRAFLDHEGRLQDSFYDHSSSDRDAEKRDAHHRRDTLKHLAILLQPTFAEAWIAEKLKADVDTSSTIIERELWELRRMLPFVREPVHHKPPGPIEVGNSNFALVMAELHNKAGDLYFHKGTHHKDIESLRRSAGGTDGKLVPAILSVRNGQEGYLLRAHYHYALGLHALRRYISYRFRASATKYDILDHRDCVREPVYAAREWPDHLFRAAGAALADLPEAALGRVSLLGTLAGIDGLKVDLDDLNLDETIRQLMLHVMAWLEDPEDHPSQLLEGEADLGSFLALGGVHLDLGTLESWLGAWAPFGASATEQSDRQGSPTTPVPPLASTGWRRHPQEAFPISADWLAFERSPPPEEAALEALEHPPASHNHLQRLLVSMLMPLVGARILRLGGYLEDAAGENLNVCTSAVGLLSWFRTLRCLVARSNEASCGEPRRFSEFLWLDTFRTLEVASLGDNDKTGPFTELLVEIGLTALELADDHFARDRLGDRSFEDARVNPKGGAPYHYSIGDRVPVEAFMALAGLVLNSPEGHWLTARRRRRLCRLLTAWGTDDLLDSNGWEDEEVEGEHDRWAQSKSCSCCETGQEWLAEHIRGCPESELAIGDIEALRALMRIMLRRALVRHSYPMLARLRGLKVLLDDTLIDHRSGGEILLDDEVVEMAQELISLADRYEAPLHFTDLELGHSLALLWLTQRKRWLSRERDEEELWRVIKRKADRHLTNALGITSMKRSYYAAIENLYYLYDDFNDRRQHFNHAQQMAGAELAQLLKECLRYSSKVAQPD